MSRLPLLVLVAVACKSTPPASPQPAPEPERLDNPLPLEVTKLEPRPPVRDYNAIDRMHFNRNAVRYNAPVYWIADTDKDGNLDPDEVALLEFYPSKYELVEDGRLSHAFSTLYDQIAVDQTPGLMTDDGKRRTLVVQDLDQGRPTLVHTKLSTLDAHDREFVTRMMAVALSIDFLYEKMNGAGALYASLPKDPESRSLFRRNRGPKCVAPATEKEPMCSAIPGAPKPVFDLYPAELQKQDRFCSVLENHPNVKELLSPFTVVRGPLDKLEAVPYSKAYHEEIEKIAKGIKRAAKVLDPKREPALIAYLAAAANSFESNDWGPADEAWAKMTVDNSRFYVRVAPDEVYWEPCSSKAGLHLTFALINQGSRAWQQKLVPVQQDMESAIAKAAGKPYATHKVTFHLPDFIDIVINAGDDRDALGATIGQSLPNWGAVANEGRGRTVAMVNLYTDPDSMAARRAQAESMLDAPSLASYAGTQEPGLLSTILHEVTHNLGPAHEYKVGGKKAGEIFGGPMASLMEELKAQTGALFLLEFLRTRKLVSDELAAQSYADSIVWALGHISQGMYTGSGERKTYSQVAAIQIGFLLEKGALTWDTKATAGNGKDVGALKINKKKLVPVVAEMMKVVAGIKARGDKAAADALAKKYVDGKVVPLAIIAERFLRFPKASFVYAITD